MAEIIIKRRCERCNGSGIFSIYGGPQVECVGCGGSGKVSVATFGDSIYFTYQIAEVTDIPEYNALSVALKQAYRDIISMGIVDLADGTAIRATLWAMFDAQSTTRANLITLLGE